MTEPQRDDPPRDGPPRDDQQRSDERRDDATPEHEHVGDAFDQGEMRERQSGRRTNRRRGGGSPMLSTISWRDIPAQLTARAGGEQSKVLLHARFQHAIDRAAGVAGLTSTDDYVREWRTASTPLGDGDVAAQLDQLCAEIESQYPKDRLEAIVANGGIDPDPPGHSVSDTD